MHKTKKPTSRHRLRLEMQTRVRLTVGYHIPWNSVELVETVCALVFLSVPSSVAFPGSSLSDSPSADALAIRLEVICSKGK